MPRRCASCGSEVSRRDCHKNRYGEYICLACAAVGVKFSRARGALRWLKKSLPKGVLWLGVFLLAILIMASMLHFFNHYNPAPVDPNSAP